MIQGEAQVAEGVAPQGAASVEPVPVIIIKQDDVASAIIEQTPTTVGAQVGGVPPYVEVYFFVGDIEVGSEDSDEMGVVEETTLSLSSDIGVGAWMLTAQVGGQVVASTEFIVQKAPPAMPHAVMADAPPVAVPEALTSTGVRKWVLQDLAPGGLGSWVMPINPSEMNPPHVRRTVDSLSTVSGEGAHLIEGAAAQDWQFGGYCPSASFQGRLLQFAELDRRFYVIDHRNRAWKVVITNVDIRLRRRKADGNDWAADYTVNLALLDEEPLTPV